MVCLPVATDLKQAKKRLIKLSAVTSKMCQEQNVFSLTGYKYLTFYLSTKGNLSAIAAKS